MVMQCSVADPVHFFRIRIRGSGLKNTDSDPVDPRKTRSNRIRFLLRYFFDVEQNKYFLWHFLTKSIHPMTLKIKDNKLFGRNCILKLEVQGGSFCI